MNVIKFPTKKRNQQRLTKALAGIQLQLDRQSEAVSEFREIGADLAENMEALEKTMLNFSAQMEKIAIKPLHKKSLKLARMMHDYRENCA